MCLKISKFLIFLGFVFINYAFANNDKILVFEETQKPVLEKDIISYKVGDTEILSPERHDLLDRLKKMLKKPKKFGSPVLVKVRVNDEEIYKKIELVSSSSKSIAESLDEKFITAIKDQNIDAINKLLKEINVNFLDRAELTPLIYALDNNNKEIVDLLISHGANVNTALEIAIKKDKSEIIEQLISLGANVKAALEIAINEDKSEIVKQLESFGADVNTVLIDLIKEGKSQNINKILAKGINVNFQDKDGFTPLIHALENNNKEMIDLLISHGANVNASLIIAIKKDQIPLINKLLALYNINVNFQDKDGLTPLIYALDLNNKDIADILIFHGADINDTLIIAIKEGKIEIVKLLLEKGADISNINDIADTLLFLFNEKNKMVPFLTIHKDIINKLAQLDENLKNNFIMELILKDKDNTLIHKNFNKVTKRSSIIDSLLGVPRKSEKEDIKIELNKKSAHFIIDLIIKSLNNNIDMGELKNIGIVEPIESKLEYLFRILDEVDPGAIILKSRSNEILPLAFEKNNLELMQALTSKGVDQ